MMGELGHFMMTVPRCNHDSELVSAYGKAALTELG